MTLESQASPASFDTAADSPEYRATIDEAVRAYSAGAWRDARDAFARAHALAPSARTLRGLGLCAFYLSDFAAARLHFEAALADRERRPLPDDQRREVAALLARTLPETGRYELRVQPPSASVSVDGVAHVGQVVVLPRGEHTLRAVAEGFDDHVAKVTVHGGEQGSLVLQLSASTAPPTSPAVVEAPAPAPTLVTPSAAPESASSSGRLYTWIALSAVPVFAGVAAGVWYAGLSKHGEIERACASRPCTEAQVERMVDAAHLDRYATWTTVALTAAGACAVAAGIAFVLEGDSDSDSDGHAKLSIGPGGVSLTVGM